MLPFESPAPTFALFIVIPSSVLQNSTMSEYGHGISVQPLLLQDRYVKKPVNGAENINSVRSIFKRRRRSPPLCAFRALSASRTYPNPVSRALLAHHTYRYRETDNQNVLAASAATAAASCATVCLFLYAFLLGIMPQQSLQITRRVSFWILCEAFSHSTHTFFEQ